MHQDDISRRYKAVLVWTGACATIAASASLYELLRGLL